MRIVEVWGKVENCFACPFVLENNYGEKVCGICKIGELRKVAHADRIPDWCPYYYYFIALESLNK